MLKVGVMLSNNNKVNVREIQKPLPSSPLGSADNTTDDNDICMYVYVGLFDSHGKQMLWDDGNAT